MSVTASPPSFTTKDVSLLGLLSGVNTPIGYILKNVLIKLITGKPIQIANFAKDLGLNLLAFDPNFDSGQFQGLAMANMNPSSSEPTPDVWEAPLRAEVQGEDPTSEAKDAAAQAAGWAPDLIQSGGPHNWGSKHPWETGAADDNTRPPQVYNRADFLTLDTLIWSRVIVSPLLAHQPIAVLVPDPQDPGKTDLQVHAPSGTVTVTLASHGWNTVEVDVNAASVGTLDSRGNLISQISAGGATSGAIATQDDIGGMLHSPGGKLLRFGGIRVNGDLSGAVVALGNIIGDVSVAGNLVGRTAANGQPSPYLASEGIEELEPDLDRSGDAGRREDRFRAGGHDGLNGDRHLL
jgi:hypothetical protein